MSGLNLFESIVAGQERAPRSGGASIKGKAIKKPPSPEANIKEKTRTVSTTRSWLARRKRKKKTFSLPPFTFLYLDTVGVFKVKK